jgi:NAD(P)-dependent dehydrogenase (short-subunit alcohol dehydrogenase family)
VAINFYSKGKNSMGILDGKVAVITGGSRGFGLAVAKAYAGAGAAVVLASRSQPSVDQAVDALRAQGYRAAGIACNVGELAEMERLKAFALESFGQLDVWVNNAGVSPAYGPTLGTQPGEFAQAVNTNILGVYYGSITALDHFRHQGKGKLINILGRGSDRPAPMQNAYGSSKIWVLWFTRALAEEYKETGVDILALNPGMMLTDLLTDVEVVEGHESKLKSFGTIIRMWAKPPEYAAAKALWLASSASDGKNGRVTNVMSPGLMLGGALKEGFRRLLRLPLPPTALKIKPVPAYKK